MVERLWNVNLNSMHGRYSTCLFLKYLTPEGIKRALLNEYENGLRNAEIKMRKDDFLSLFEKILLHPDLHLWLDVYLDSFIRDERVPQYIYHMGLGHRLFQHDIRKSYRILYLRHMTELQRLGNIEIVLPDISYNLDDVTWRRGRDILLSEENRWYVRTQFDDGDEKFFGYLHLATQSSRLQRWYLSWVYSLSALDHITDESFRPSVYLQIALSSANLCISPKITWFAMEEALKTKQKVGLDWEWAVVFFRVCTVFGLFCYTNGVFEDIERRISTTSAWHDSLIVAYLSSLMHQIENEFICDMANFNINLSETMQSEVLKLKMITWVKTFNSLSSKLKTPGASHYYIAYTHVYKSFGKLTRRSTLDSLARALQYFIKASEALPKTDVRSVEAKLMVLFLRNESNQAGEVSKRWNEHTKTQYSVLKAETWLRMALLNILTSTYFESTWYNSKGLLTFAIENYSKATLESGYRIKILKNAKKYWKRIYDTSDHDSMAINSHYDPDEWTKMYQVDIDSRISSSAFLRSDGPQQAFCIGQAICSSTF